MVPNLDLGVVYMFNKWESSGRLTFDYLLPITA